MTEADVVTAFDLEAYVDGQLDPQRRFEVEDHLARNPVAAALVMADMRARDAVRLLAAEPLAAATPGQIESVGRLKGGLRRAGRDRMMGRVAAATALMMTGALAGRFVSVERPQHVAASEFVAEAVQAHRTSLMRAAMNSQPEAVSYNPSEIRSATRIVLPQLPNAWRVTDVQVFPSDDGPTVAMALDTEDMGPISLFAADAPEFADNDPQTVQAGRRAVSYWQVGHLAYALTGQAAPEVLEAAASKLSAALREKPWASRTVPLTGAASVNQ